MSIIIRKNKHTASILRPRYVRKGTEGNDYGFVRRFRLETISLSATEVPQKISALLSERELEHLHRVVIQPARQKAERARKAAEERERDPIWRLQEAIKWLSEAAKRAKHANIPDELRQHLDAACAPFRPSRPAQQCQEEDAIQKAVQAVKQATAAVVRGDYGRNTEEQVRKDTLAGKRWADLRAATLDENGSLLAALQEARWVTKRNRSA